MLIRRRKALYNTQEPQIIIILYNAIKNQLCQAGWMEILSNFYFDLIYHPGCEILQTNAFTKNICNKVNLMASWTLNGLCGIIWSKTSTIPHKILG